MTQAETTPRDQLLLNQAASLLDHAGRAAGKDHGLLAIRSLHAADLLVTAGAQINPAQARVINGDARSTVHQALQLLGQLSPATFDDNTVIEATEAAQQAFAAS
jgi:hypothetical protein